MRFVNKYTVGAAVALLLISALWLSFGGKISAWRAGAPKATRANVEVIAELTKTKAELVEARKIGVEALANYTRARAAMQVLTQEISALHRKAEEANARGTKHEQMASELQTRVDELEAQLRTQPKAATLSEAFRAIQNVGPPYSR